MCRGGYDEPDAFVRLQRILSDHEKSEASIRLLFFAVPPAAFPSLLRMSSTYLNAVEGSYTRLVIEKPFGSDSSSFAALQQLCSEHYRETQVFRLDHYLGKEVVLNIATLRWGNQLFEPTWSNKYIESVQLTFKEDLGCGGRGGYFDQAGIIRDVMQSHLLQMFMWMAMEPPASMSAHDIVRAKIELLRCVPTLPFSSGEMFLGQYTACDGEPGYRDDPTVPEGSHCPTFAAFVMHVANDRWAGVPFLFTAGKGLDERVCELRVRYKPQALNQMVGVGDDARNELVVRCIPHLLRACVVGARDHERTLPRSRHAHLAKLTSCDWCGRCACSPTSPSTC